MNMEAPCGGLRVSAPGKVLLTGGYLILEEQFAGLVLATSARFHTTVSHRRVEGSAVSLVNHGEDVVLQIRVESPQFNQTVVTHVVRVGDDRLDIRMRFVCGQERKLYIKVCGNTKWRIDFVVIEAIATRMWKKLCSALLTVLPG
jgi:phosphomevalonate kinase